MTKAASSALVILAAGGTGGHMFPAEALARALQARGMRVALVTDIRGGAFGESLPDVEVHRIHAGRLGRDLMVRVRAVFDMGLGFVEARTLLAELRPAAVVGFGGYPSIPTVIAAALRKIPVVLHEQNALLGRANRRLASRARVIATSFAHVARMPASAAAVTTGNPVRPGILAARQRPYVKPEPNGALSIFVMGGSQGAHVFAEVVPAAVARLPDSVKKRIRVVQQCRPEDLDETRAAFAQAGVEADLASFFTDVPNRLAACHLVISRSGASTVAELGVAGRPAILVPYPFATDDHQAANAESFAAGGGAWVMGQRAFTAASLADRIETLMAMPDELARAAAAARASGLPDAADRLADLVLAQIGNREGGMGPFDRPRRRDIQVAA
jgi:UDP-N-acetylglucosamine--N-acetylmuramyl-(pentapeptide) pyrophosphoryl-undecaprenol N-acetylglucosamine transferase